MPKITNLSTNKSYDVSQETVDKIKDNKSLQGVYRFHKEQPIATPPEVKKSASPINAPTAEPAKTDADNGKAKNVKK